AREGWAKGLRLVRPVKLAVELAGFAPEIALKKVDLRACTLKSAELRLTGSAANLVEQRGLDLNFSLRGNDFNKLKDITAQPFIFAPLPGQGAYALSGRISDPKAKVYEIKDFKFSTAGTKLSGRMDINLAGRLPAYEVNMSTPKFNLKPIPIPKDAAYANIIKIDDLGPLKISSKVIVERDRLSMPYLDMRAGREQLTAIEVKGSIRDLTTLRGINLDFNIQGQEVANLAKITGESLPLQGAFALSGKLTDPAQKNYKIGDLALRLGGNNITGSLDLNLSGKQLQLATDLAAPKFTLQPVTLPALERLSRVEDLGPLKLKLNLTDAGNTLALGNLDLSVGREEIILLLLKGKISDLSAVKGMDLTFTIKGRDITKVTGAGGSQMNSKGAFQFSGQFSDPAPKVYRLPVFEAVWGDSQSSGSLELDTSGQRPRLKAELSSDKLDLRPFLKPLQDKGAAEPQTAKGGLPTEKKPKANRPAAKPATRESRVFSTDPLPLAELQKIDAEVKFRGKQVLLRATAFDNITLDTLLKNGNLDIKPIKFAIGGGKADGWFNLKSQKKPTELRMALTIDQLAIGPMLDQLDYSRSVEGNLDTVIDLDGSGDSIAALMAGLNGDIRIAVKDGKAESKYLDLLAKYLGSGILRMINPFEAKRQYTPINCFVNTVAIDNGKADIKLLLDTDQTSIFGAGDVDLKTERLDLGIKPTPKKGALPANISFSLNDLSQPFRLGGTLANPSLGIDPGRTAFVIGKMAGALALGPIGIAAFFADVSIGKKNACEVALEKAMGKDQ
ncbi:MAG: AsmA family protein, partial [Deltaproteobacteria bacterium]|nr:AsmA family protein [Deltaproteobacteria bacterium]